MTAQETLQNHLNAYTHLGEKRSALKSEIKQIWLEAAATGFDRQVAKQFLHLKKIDAVPGLAAHIPASLLPILKKIEERQAERKKLKSEIRKIINKAAEDGFDGKVIKTLFKNSRKNPERVEEEETLLDIYKSVLGL